MANFRYRSESDGDPSHFRRFLYGKRLFFTESWEFREDQEVLENMCLVYINAGKTPPEASCSAVFWRHSMEGFRGGPVRSFAIFTEWTNFRGLFRENVATEIGHGNSPLQTPILYLP